MPKKEVIKYSELTLEKVMDIIEKTEDQDLIDEFALVAFKEDGKKNTRVVKGMFYQKYKNDYEWKGLPTAFTTSNKAKKAEKELEFKNKWLAKQAEAKARAKAKEETETNEDAE